MIYTNWKIFDRYLHMCFFNVCHIPIQHNDFHYEGGGAESASPLVTEAAEGRLDYVGWECIYHRFFIFPQCGSESYFFSAIHTDR